MKNRILAFLLTLCLFSLFACSAETQTEDKNDMQEVIEAQQVEPVDEENPDASGTYQIQTVKGLLAIREHPDANCVLVGDIDLGGMEWTPICSADQPYTGEFSGNGYTVSNFTLKSENGLTGFFGVVDGQISNLNLNIAGFSLDGNENNTVGGFAAICNGKIRKSTVNGTLSLGGSGELTVGGCYGSGKGNIGESTANLNIILFDRTGKTTVGAFAGDFGGETIAISNATAQLVLSGSESDISAGLFCGKASNAKITNTSFEGSMNLKNAELFCDFVGSGSENEFSECYYRDNHNNLEPMSEEERKMRDDCEAYMYAMGNVEWTVSQITMFEAYNHNSYSQQSFFPGIVYRGLPYTSKMGSLERFEYAMDENGCMKDTMPNFGFDGFDDYMGNDCSGAVLRAWSRCSNTLSFTLTWNMMPANLTGTLPVGDYDAFCVDPGKEVKTQDIIDFNTPEVIAEAYCKLKKADAVLRWDNGGHTRLCADNAAVMLDQNGEFSLDHSFVLMDEQGSSSENSTWRLHYKYHFNELLDLNYIPITCQDLIDGKMEEPVAEIDEKGEGIGYLAVGTVSANYPIDSVSMKITLDGQDEWEQRFFAGVSKIANYGESDYCRLLTYELPLADFIPGLCSFRPQSGKTYHCDVTAHLSTGDDIVVKSYDFKA